MVPESQYQHCWEGYRRTPSIDAKRSLVLQYLDLVRYVVSKLGSNGLSRGGVLERDDLVHYGVMGLMDAIDRFSPATGVRFETFAIPRIRGAILDELRKLDWVPRSVRANTRKLARAAEEVVRETGREAVDLEIAGKLAMTPEEYREFIKDTEGTMRYHKSDPAAEESTDVVENVAEPSPNPIEQITDAEVKTLLIDAIKSLPAREHAIIALYYYEGLRFWEIGKILRISESRVSQIHSELLRDLRARLGALQA